MVSSGFVQSWISVTTDLRWDLEPRISPVNATVICPKKNKNVSWVISCLWIS